MLRDLPWHIGMGTYMSKWCSTQGSPPLGHIHLQNYSQYQLSSRGKPALLLFERNPVESSFQCRLVHYHHTLKKKCPDATVRGPQSLPFYLNPESSACTLSHCRWQSWYQPFSSPCVYIIKEFTRNLKGGAIQEIKTKCVYLQACLLGWQIDKVPMSCFCEGMKRLRKLSALKCVTSQHGHACWCGRCRHGRFSWQQPRNLPSCWETDVGKSHRGSHTLWLTHIKVTFDLSQELSSKYIFMSILESHKSSALLPLMGFRLLTLCRPHTELIVRPFPTTLEGSFRAQVPSLMSKPDT